jgi:tetratricopeptide (TPR) repeat protein
MTIAKYLAIFRENEANRTKLLDEDTGDLRRDSSVPNAVITTWQISFDQIRKHQRSATELLSLMSVLDSQGIPEFLLSRSYDTLLKFEDALSPLIDFSMIMTETGRQAFDMHPLVQLAMRKWLTLRGELEIWQRESIRIISETFPDGEHAHLITCAALEPHAQIVLGYDSTHPPCRLEQARILQNSGWYAWARGNYETAKVRTKKAVEIREELLGKEHPNTLMSMNNLASALSDQGKYEQAEEMNRQVLRLREVMLGKEHPDTLTSMNNLASALSDQGKYEQAEEMNQQILRLREVVLGKEHPDTLKSMNNLASALSDQGKYEQAEEMDRQVLRLKEVVLGKEHPDTLTSMNNLALALSDQGKYEQAEEMDRQVLRLKEVVLGKEHPDTLKSMGNLALVLSHQGKYEQAEEMDRQVLRLKKVVLGKEHPDTLKSMGNLALVLSTRKRFSEADPLYQRALDGYGKSLAPDHPTVQACRKHYSHMLKEMQEDIGEEEILFQGRR